LTGLARNEMITGTITRFHVQCLRRVVSGLAVLAALGVISCAKLDRESPETEEPLKFDLLCEVDANGGLQCVLNIENCGTRPVLVSRYVFVSAKSEVLYPPGSLGFEFCMQVGTGHPFDPEEFIYLFPRDRKDMECTEFPVRFSLGSEMLLEHDRYPAVLTVDGTVFVVALKGEANWQIENSSRKSWEGSFTAQHVPFSVKVPMPKKPKTK